jgi:hypothetical protein
MYLCGIIPSPHAPHGAALQYYLVPLIDDLMASWVRGVFYPQTALHPRGRVARTAVVCEVCDLIGGHDLAGLASCTSNHFCSICQLTGVNKNLACYDREKWVNQDVEKMCHLAMKW